MGKVGFDHSKLKGICRERGETLETLSQKLGISKHTLSNKWNGKTAFTDAEIFALKCYLGINDLVPYFFTPNV